MKVRRNVCGPGVGLVAALALLAGCGGGSGHGGSSFSFLSVDRITPNAGGAANSSLDDPATSTAVCVLLSNNLKNPGVTTPSPLDAVTITSYAVTFTRFDGGEPPGPFTINTAFTVPAGTVSGTPPTAADNTANVLIVVVPAQAKRQPPLSDPRPRLPLSTSATIHFEGRNGRGDHVSVDAAVPVTFIAGVETEPVPSCT